MQKNIIKREEKQWKRWTEMTVLQWKAWREHVFKRTDPGTSEQIPEIFGDFVYFIREKPFP